MPTSQTISTNPKYTIQDRRKARPVEASLIYQARIRIRQHIAMRHPVGDPEHPPESMQEIIDIAMQDMAVVALQACYRILRGLPVGQAKPPTMSDVRSTAAMVLDRLAPVISRSQSLNVSANTTVSPAQEAKLRKIIDTLSPIPVPLGQPIDP